MPESYFSVSVRSTPGIVPASVVQATSVNMFKNTLWQIPCRRNGRLSYKLRVHQPTV